MTDLMKPGRQTLRVYISLLSISMLGAAVALACLVGLVTFPALSDISGQSVIGSIVVTAIIVAIPLVFVMAVLISKVAGQKLDLAAREELFVTAQQIGKFGYWHYDLATEEFTLSDSLHDLLGDPDRRLRMNVPKLLEMTNPEDRENIAEALRRIIMEGTSEEHEYRLTGLDGIEKTFWIDGKRMVDGAGKPIRAHGACQDISDRKLIEAALRESEDHYRHAVELNAQIPWTADPDGNIEEIGPLWFQYMGGEREQAIGTGWVTVLHPEDLDSTYAAWNAALKSGHPLDVEYRLRQADGKSYRWFRARAAARKGDEGEVIRWYGTLEDIHDRKMADVALRESEEFARSILDSSPDCVRVLDLDGRVRFINGPGLRSLEVDDFEGRTLGRNWPDLWPADARPAIEEGLDTARAGRIAQFSGFCPTAKGTPRWWDVSVSPILGADGKPDRLLAISRDKTGAKHVQDELDQARREAEKLAQRLENVLSSTTDSVITFDRQLRVVYLNKKAQDNLPGGEKIVGMMRQDAFPELLSTPFEEHFQRAFQQWETVHYEGYFEPYDRWLNCHIYPSADGISVFFKDVSERRRAQDQILYLAHHDALTGLVNRTVLHERLEKSMAAVNPEKQTALLFLDLDEFKAVNDALGHSAGDRLLVQVSKRLKRCVRESDLVARFGGDEFAVIAEVNGPKEAASLAERIIGSLNQPYKLDGNSVTVGTSIGIVIVSDAGTSVDHALGNADIALYEAKAEGRGVYRIFETEMAAIFQEREALKQDLRVAAERGEFSINYQPLFDLKTNRVNGFEALLRWKHPTRGQVAPAVFIPIAEASGLIAGIGEWVLRTACRKAASWPDGITVAVNLSPLQFRSGDLVQTVVRSLSESGLAGERLQLEITENVLLADSAANIEVLHELRKLGASIAMDDFGTGYSSLSYLRSFPFDKIKIDRTFVSDLIVQGGSSEQNPIIRAILDLAGSLGITTTAEGVETQSQLSVLRAMGCNEGQGFLFSKPVGPEDVAPTIARLNGREDCSMRRLQIGAM